MVLASALMRGIHPLKIFKMADVQGGWRVATAFWWRIMACSYASPAEPTFCMSLTLFCGNVPISRMSRGFLILILILTNSETWIHSLFQREEVISLASEWQNVTKHHDCYSELYIYIWSKNFSHSVNEKSEAKWNQDGGHWRPIAL
jgi:hypothetical protein